MRYCCVTRCRNRSRRSQRNSGVKVTTSLPISFHQLPKEEDKRRIWLKNLKLSDDMLNKKNPTVCSEHFCGDCFTKTKGNKTFLRQDAVPTLLAGEEYSSEDIENISSEKYDYHIDRMKNPYPVGIQLENSSADIPSPNDRDKNSNDLESVKEIIYYGIDTESEESLVEFEPTPMEKPLTLDEKTGEFVTNKIDNASIIENSHSESLDLETELSFQNRSSISPPNKCCNGEEKILKVDRSTSISPIRKVDSPEVMRLKKVLDYENKKKVKVISNLRRKLQRRDKLIENLKKRLSQVENIVSFDDLTSDSD